MADLATQTIQQFIRGPIDRGVVIAQFDQIGVRSISIVAITSLFIGMVLALQTAYSLADFGGALFIGKVVSLSLVRELAPVLMSLMVGGRVGAGIDGGARDDESHRADRRACARWRRIPSASWSCRACWRRRS